MRFPPSKAKKLTEINCVGKCLMTTALGEGMEEVFWDGIDGVGGWEQRSKDSPHDIFVCIGASCP